jgi:hypothetical protein
MKSCLRLRALAATAVCAVGCMLAAAAFAAPAGAFPVASAAGLPQPGPQLPYQISDSFNGTSLNSAVWFTDSFQNAGTSQVVQDGSLQLTASSAASSGFHDGILARCQAVGDFDAQIHFTLSTWPAGDNVTLAVNAPPLGNTFVESAVGGDVYGLFVQQPLGYITIPRLPTRSGELRLSRRGDLTSAYFRAGYAGMWHQIDQFSGSTSPTFVGVAIWNISDFGGQPVSVQVDSFKLDAAGLSCF